MFMNALQKCYQSKRLDQIAIDEIHCVSAWGHDFRPDYKYLGVLKNIFPDVPLIGFTATATTKVITDVQKMLNLKECVVFKAPFNRPNLYYHVLEKPSEKKEAYDLVADLLKHRFRGKTGIIYTFSIKDTVDLTSELLQRDVKVRPYHGNLENDQRVKVHKKWIDGDIQAVVATTAFGMGIDNPNVRFVIHQTMSKSIENFYQETGRAGRDGKRADVILLYRFADMFKMSTMMFAEHTGLKNVYSMVEYCINGKKCRRDLLSKHFTEIWEDHKCDKMCDRCYYKDRVLTPEINIVDHYNTLREIIERAENLQAKLTGAKLVDAWFHKGPVKNRIETPPPMLDRYIGEQILAYLLINDYFKEDFQYTAYATNSYITIGGRRPSKGAIRYQPSRIFDLPSIEGIDSDCEVMSLASSNSDKQGKRKKHGSEKETKKKRKNGHVEHETSVIESDDDDVVVIPQKEVIIDLSN
jgi:ATP-dependent DNA helicase Q1